MRFVYLALLNLSLLSALSACGRQSPRRTETPPPTIAESTPKASILTGPLGKTLMEIQASPYVEDCDKASKLQQQEIINALDEKTQSIQEFSKSHSQPTNNGWENVHIGEAYFSRPAKEMPPPHKGWEEYKWYNWIDLYQYYLGFKDAPIDARWAWLSKAARSLLVDDQRRIIMRFNYGLDRKTRPLLSAASQEIQSCLQNTNCDLANIKTVLSPETLSLLEGNPIYKPFLDLLTDNSRSLNERRDYLHSLSLWLIQDAKDNSFVPNASVRRLSTSTLELPLTGEISEDIKQFITNVLESSWKVSDHNLKILWKPASNLPDIFHVLLSNTWGQRAYASLGKRFIQLFYGTSTKSIAHEIGHVLGFPDSYYTVWHPEQCRYIDQYNGDDIMSDAETGEVLVEHWAKLNEVYPLPKDASVAPPPLQGSTSSNGLAQP